jgi:hypothetical protein
VTASSCWRLGSGMVRSAEASGGALRRWPSLEATCGGEEKQAGASGGMARRPAATLLRGRGEAEEEEGGGCARG